MWGIFSEKKGKKSKKKDKERIEKEKREEEKRQTIRIQKILLFAFIIFSFACVGLIFYLNRYYVGKSETNSSESPQSYPDKGSANDNYKRTADTPLQDIDPGQSSDARGDDFKRAAKIIMYYIRLFKVETVLDLKCSTAPGLAKILLKEFTKLNTKGKKTIFYLCMEPDHELYMLASNRLKTIYQNSIFYYEKYQTLRPKADLILGWDLIQRLPVSEGRSLLNLLAINRDGHIFLTNNPGRKNPANASMTFKYARMNLFESPFMLSLPEKKFVNINVNSTSSQYPKDLLLYRTSQIKTKGQK